VKSDIARQLDGYEALMGEIAAARKYGSDFTPQRGRFQDAVSRLHPRRVPLRVSRIIDETPSTRTLRLVPAAGGLPPFQAGQYITLYFDLDGVRTARPYSLSSAPSQTAFWEITVRRVADGLVSNHLLDLAPGALLESSGPAGTFVFNPVIHPPHLVCIAGGSGITPLMSMIRETVQRDLPRRITLIYGSRGLDDVIFHAELDELARNAAQLDYIPVIEDPPAGYSGRRGLIDAGMIRETCGALDDKVFFVCGPQGLYDHLLPLLAAPGIPRRRLRREIYGAPADVWEQPGWPAEVNREARFTVILPGGRRIDAPAAEPLIRSLENSGCAIESLCRSGACSLCRVKLLTGRVFQPPGVPVRGSDRRFGYIHACVSYPLSDLEVLL
jgi:glycine betaine catabolism B